MSRFAQLLLSTLFISGNAQAGNERANDTVSSSDAPTQWSLHPQHYGHMPSLAIASGLVDNNLLRFYIFAILLLGLAYPITHKLLLKMSRNYHAIEDTSKQIVVTHHALEAFILSLLFPFKLITAILFSTLFLLWETMFVERATTVYNILRRFQIEKTQTSGGTWKNWSRNIWYDGPPGYIKYPKTQEDLKAILADAHAKEIPVRASGQQHSQPPQIVPDRRSILPSFCNKKLELYVIDMSFYQDIPAGDNSTIVRMKVLSREDTGEAVVAVNAGTREDDLEYFVAKENLALQTVTAGGVFSIGGMTSNDVHGASIKVGIFADTCKGFTIMKWDGTILEIHEDDLVRPDGYRPIQFARVNLGLLGIVTRILVKCDSRPTKQSLEGSMSFVHTTLEQEFVDKFLDFVKHDRLQAFYDPYTGGFLPIMWDLTPQYDNIGTPNKPAPPKESTEERALKNCYGAEGHSLDRLIQCSCSDIQNQPSAKPASIAMGIVMGSIANTQVTSAFTAYSETWLQTTSSVILMSYFVELPDLGRAGLEKTYRLLKVVTDLVTVDHNFHITAPLDFRFVKAGDSVMAGTYKKDAGNSDTWYVNLDVVAFLSSTKWHKNPKNYPDKLKDFMASVEREWYNAGGLPHQGKMYGFFDPTGRKGNSSPPFNENFIQAINQRRDERDPNARKAFNNYRKEVDPNNMFLNEYMSKLLTTHKCVGFLDLASQSLSPDLRANACEAHATPIAIRSNRWIGRRTRVRDCTDRRKALFEVQKKYVFC